MAIPISVVIPTNNREYMLKKCINALAKQTFQNFEVIVVGSPTDRSEGTIVDFKPSIQVRYLRQKKSGPAEARNVGIEAAKGKIIAFTDDDCVPAPDWIENILKFIGDADGVEGITLPPKSKILTPFSHALVNKDPDRFLTCNIAYKRSALKKVGNYCEEFRIGKLHFREDSDLAFSILERGGRIKFSKDIRVEHAVYLRSSSDFLTEKRVFELDPLLYKRHPKLYKKCIKFPFERFTPFYMLFTVLCLAGFPLSSWLVLTSLLGLALTTEAELLKRGWKASLAQFFKFLGGQIAGSFIILYSVLKGCWKFRVNPLKLFWVR